MDLYFLRPAAEKLGLHYNTLYNWCRRGWCGTRISEGGVTSPWLVTLDEVRIVMRERLPQWNMGDDESPETGGTKNGSPTSASENPSAPSAE